MLRQRVHWVNIDTVNIFCLLITVQNELSSLRSEVHSLHKQMKVMAEKQDGTAQPGEGHEK
jgi:hypothetical protein